MNILLTLLFISCAVPQQEGQQGSPLSLFLPFLLIILIMYFLMIRPQSKKQKEKQKMLQNLQPGDEVITIGGIIGKVESIKEKDNTLVLRVDKDVKINISRSAVADKINK